MAGKKLLIAVSLLLSAMPAVCVLAADVKAQSSIQYRKFFSAGRGPCLHNCGYATRLLYDSLNDRCNTVDFPGKAGFSG